MGELKQFVCPNCGANITNTKNCDYCGSLLVRLLDNGIDAKTYLSEHGILPGLIKALQENIRLQKENNKLAVATDIYGEYFTKEDYCFASVVSSNHLKFRSGKKAFPYTKEGIGVVFCFEIKSFKWLEKDDVNVIESKRIKNTHEKFKNLEIFNLFTSYTTSEKVLADEDKYYEYAIDFGEDAEGAARLLSDVLNQVYDIPIEGHLDYITNVGDDIENSRFEHDEDAKVYKGIFLKGAMILPILLLLVYFGAPLLGRHFEFSFVGLALMYVVSVFIAMFLKEEKAKKEKKARIGK